MFEQQSTTKQAQLDLQQAVTFARAIAGVGGILCWQTFDDDKSRKAKVGPPKRRELTKVLDGSFTKESLRAHLSKLKALNETGAGIFLTISETDGRGRRKANVVRPRAFYVEFDERDGQHPPESWPLEPSIIVQSKGGRHVYWLMDGAPLPEFRRVQEALIEKFGSDRSIKNTDRVMRVPGFLHLKDPMDPFLVQLVACEEERRYGYVEFCEAMGIALTRNSAARTVGADQPPDEVDVVGASVEAEPLGLPPLEVRLSRLRDHLATYAPAVEGRHGDARTFQLGKLLGDFGLTVAEAWTEVHAWNARCLPPWEETELRTKLERALANREDPIGSRFAREEAAAGRPTIKLTSDIDGIVEQAVTHLANLPDVYSRGPVVELVREENGAVVIRTAGVHRLQQLLGKAGRYIEPRKNGTWIPVRVPLWLARCVAEHPLEPMRHLRGVVDAPVLRADGTVLDEAGYDEATGLFLTGDVDCPCIPEAPTLDDARAALDTLLEVVSDFPFRLPADRSAWLSGVLTVLGRPAISGPTPMLGIEGNVRGSGKGLLADTIGIMATGGRVPTMTLSSSAEELRKAVTAKLLEAPPLVLFDNVTGTIGSPVLDALLTTEVWEDRILGVSRVARLRNTTLWMMTGNNPQLGGDLVRRLLPVRLVSLDEHPEHRSGFRHPNLRAYVMQHRGKLVAAALTVLRAYVVAGRPSQGLEPFGSFEAWSDIVRNTIVWCGEDDPLQSRVHLEQVADDATGELASLLLAWEQAQLRLRAIGLTAREAIAHAEFDTDLHEVIHSAPCKPSPKGLGRYLATVRDRIVEGRRLVASADGKGTLVWSVMRMDGSTPAAPRASMPPLDQNEIDPDVILATMLEDD